MQDVFYPVCLLRDYPYFLECLTCYDNILIVGTRQGLLLVYEIRPDKLRHNKCFIPSITACRPGFDPVSSTPIQPATTTVGQLSWHQLTDQDEAVDQDGQLPSFTTCVQTTRTLGSGKKPILQLEALPSLDLLLTLSDGQMTVYQLDNLQLITSVPMSKGATCFTHLLTLSESSNLDDTTIYSGTGSDSVSLNSLDSVSKSVSSTSAPPTLHICVAVKRHLFTWIWSALRQQFQPPSSPSKSRMGCLHDLTLPDTALSVNFNGSSHVIVGLKSDYLSVSLTTGEHQVLSHLGSSQQPLVCPLTSCLPLSITAQDSTIGQVDWTSLLNESVETSTSSLTTPATMITTSTPVVKASRLRSASSCLSSSSVARSRLFGLVRDQQLVILDGYNFCSTNSLASHPSSFSPHRSFKLNSNSLRRLHTYPPFLLTATNGSLDVSLLGEQGSESTLIQSLVIGNRVGALCHNQSGWLFAATSGSNSTPPTPKSPGSVVVGGNQVWLLLSANRLALIRQTIQLQEFDTALRLAQSSSLPGQLALDTRPIMLAYALSLYSSRSSRLDLAFDLLLAGRFNPFQVVGLFPVLCPEPCARDYRYPIAVLSFTSDQLRQVAEPLITYLLKLRRQLLQHLTTSSSQPTPTTPNAGTRIFKVPVSHFLASTLAHTSVGDNSPPTLTFFSMVLTEGGQLKVPCAKPNDDNLVTTTSLLELTDSTLFQCYLATNPARVVPLLRQPNYCHLASCEAALTHANRLEDLVLLYQSRGLAMQALQLLKEMALSTTTLPTKEICNGHESLDSNSSSPLTQSHIPASNRLESSRLRRYRRRTVAYLQRLGPLTGNSLLIRCTDWLIDKCPTAWMQVIAAWERQLLRSSPGSTESDASSYRFDLLAYLDKKASHLVIPFLEHIIFTPIDTDAITDDESDREVTVIDQGDLSNLTNAAASYVDCDKESLAESNNDQSIVMTPDKAELEEAVVDRICEDQSNIDTSGINSKDLSSTSTTSVANKTINLRWGLWPLPCWHNCSYAVMGHNKDEQTTQNDPDRLPSIDSRRFDESHSQQSVELHTRYASALILLACNNRLEIPTDPPSSQAPSPPLRLQRRLFRFLTHPGACYNASTLLAHLPNDGSFLDERAILLTKLNKHEQVLSLWVHVLDKWDRALSHCSTVYSNSRSRDQYQQDQPPPTGIPPGSLSSSIGFQNRSTPPIPHNTTSSHSLSSISRTGRMRVASSSTFTPQSSPSTSLQRLSDNQPLSSSLTVAIDSATETSCSSTEASDIFTLLLRVCLQPLALQALDIVLPPNHPFTSGTVEPQPKVDQAIELISRFGDRIDALQAVHLLPNEVKLSLIGAFLKTKLIHQDSILSHFVFLHQPAKAELRESRVALIRATERRFFISTGSLCRICRRRIGSSAFVRHPSTGDLEHYGCSKLLS